MRTIYYEVSVMVLLLFGIPFSIGTQERTKSPPRPLSSLTPEEIFRQVSPSVFVVEISDEQGAIVALGSGVAVHATDAECDNSQQLGNLVDCLLEQTRSTLIVTNTHVIDPGVSIRVRQGDKSWPAKIEQIDLHADLTRLRISEFHVQDVDLRPSTTVAVGERVYAIGSPEGLELSMSEGLISGLREVDAERLIQTTAPISHGSSGGGLFDSQGKLVGITTFMLTAGQSLNFAVPTEAIMEKTSSINSSLIYAHSDTGLNYEEASRLGGKDLADNNLKEVQLAQQILRRDPENAEAHAALGDGLLLSDAHRALRELNEALRLGSNNARTHLHLGMALRNVGDPYGAIAELRRSVDLDPTSERAHDVLMDVLMVDEAPAALVLKEAQIVARMDPNYGVEFFPVAKWLAEHGDKNSGTEVCKEILNATLQEAFVHYCNGIVQWLSDPMDKNQSVAEFRQAVTLGDGFADFHHTLAVALELTGRYEEAVREYKRAIEIVSNDPITKGSYERALTELQSSLGGGQRGPNVAASTERRRKLEKEIGCDARVLLRCSNPEN